MIPRVCKVSQAEPTEQQLYYIRGIARNRLDPFDDKVALRLLKHAHAAGVDIEKFKAWASTAPTWEQFTEGLNLLAQIPDADVSIVDRAPSNPSPEVVHLLGLDSGASIKQSVTLAAAAKNLSSPEEISAEIVRQALANGEIVITIDYEHHVYYVGRSRDGGGRTLALREPWTPNHLASAIRAGFQLSF